MERNGIARKDVIDIIILLAGTFVICLNQTLLSPALPTLMKQFNVAQTTVQWLTSAYSLVMAIMTPVSPTLLGRFSSRNIFIAGLAIFTCGSALAAVAPAFWMLLLGRVLQAVAAGMTLTMSITLVMLIFPLERRGTCMGLIMLITGVAPAIGPTLSGLLIGAIGWRALFGLVVAIAIVALLVSIKFLGSHGSFKSTGFDVPSFILVAIGLVCMLYGFSSFASAPNKSIIAGLVAAGIVILAVFCRRQLKLSAPFLNIKVLAVRNYRAGALIAMMIVGLTTGMSVIIPLYLQNACGYTALMTGLVMLPGALLGALSGLVSGRLSDKVGSRACAVPAAIVLVIALGTMCTFGVRTPLTFVAVSYAVMYIAMQFLNTPVNAFALSALPNEVIHHAQSLNNTLNYMFASLITAVTISVSSLVAGMSGAADQAVRTADGYHAAFVILTAMVALIAVLTFVFIKGKPKRDAEEGAESYAVEESQQ